MVKRQKKRQCPLPIFKKISQPVKLPNETKTLIKDRIRGWAELEHENSDFSERQGDSLLKALSDACLKIEQAEMMAEVDSWDFLSSQETEEWRARIDARYDSANIALMLPSS